MHQNLCLKIISLRLPVNLWSLESFPDCCSALITSWFYNQISCQTPHSTYFQTICAVIASIQMWGFFHWSCQNFLPYSHVFMTFIRWIFIESGRHLCSLFHLEKHISKSLNYYFMSPSSRIILHYTAKSIHSPIQIIKFRCSHHFHGHRCINSSTSACRLLLKTSVKEWSALRSSVNSSVVPW